MIIKFQNLRNDHQLISNSCISLQWKHLNSSVLGKERCHDYTKNKEKKHVFWLFLSDRAFCLNLTFRCLTLIYITLPQFQSFEMKLF